MWLRASGSSRVPWYISPRRFGHNTSSATLLALLSRFRKVIITLVYYSQSVQPSRPYFWEVCLHCNARIDWRQTRPWCLVEERFVLGGLGRLEGQECGRGPSSQRGKLHCVYCFLSILRIVVLLPCLHLLPAFLFVNRWLNCISCSMNAPMNAWIDRGLKSWLIGHLYCSLRRNSGRIAGFFSSPCGIGRGFLLAFGSVWFHERCKIFIFECLGPCFAI